LPDAFSQEVRDLGISSEETAIPKFVGKLKDL
jgi:hypothetical protein